LFVGGKELHIPSGGPWGGTCVDREYLDFLENLFGHDVWSEFIKENPEDLLEIKRKFECLVRDRNCLSFGCSSF
jgi:hypothetical protein